MTGDAKLFIRAEQRLGEAIIWHAAQQCLFWIDLLAPALFRHCPKTGGTEHWPLDLAPPIGAIAATEDPDLLALTHRHGIALLRISDRTMRPWCDPERGRDGVIYNDAKVDRAGRLWAGTSDALERDPRGALWHVHPGGDHVLADAGFVVANGPAFSPDGNSLYFNDSVGRTTFAYDIEGDHRRLVNRRRLIVFGEEDGLPDGIITDAEGCLWIAHWGAARVSRWSPAGERLGTWAVPAVNVTTMCFGPGSTLYITTARDGVDDATLAQWPLTGSLFTLETQTRGIPEPLLRLAD